MARPGEYAAAPGERLSSLILRAGGFADNALLTGAVLTRPATIAARRAELSSRIDRAAAEAPTRAGDAERLRPFFETLRKLEPTGRLPVRLAHPRLLKGSEQDIPLQDGDRLFIPSEPGGVAVTGAVRLPDAPPHRWSPKAGYADYVRMSGGFAPDAEPSPVWLVKADGSVTRLTRELLRWNGARSRWEIAPFAGGRPRVEPGDRIVVTRKPGALSRAGDRAFLDPLREEIAAMTGVVPELP